MNCRILLLLCISCINLVETRCQNNNEDFDIMGERFYKCNMKEYPDSLVDTALQMIKDDGSFMDIDYSSRESNLWQPRTHYYRLYYMAYAYVNPLNKKYADNELLSAIINGLKYWVQRKPESDNWWYLNIEVPEMIGKLLLLIQYSNLPKVNDNLLSELIDYYKTIQVDPSIYTGANRSKVAIHWVYFGILKKDSYFVDYGLENIFCNLEYADGRNGFKIDNSFLETGHIYIGAYGEQMLETILQMSSIIDGTKYSLDDQKLQLLRTYFLDTYANLVRGQCMMYNCMGRSMTYRGFLKNVTKRVSYSDRMKLTDPIYENEYELISKRFKGEADASEITKESHHHYFCADYTRHNRKKYNFSVSMVSERSCRSEYGNGEAQCTYYVSDGSTCLLRTGEEYTDIMPLWDWRKVPGTTVPDLDNVPVGKQWTVYGKNKYAGGVSDSIYGCSAYKYYDNQYGVNTGASKGWFFFDDEVVCLGAGIKSEHPLAYTTIEQNWGGQSFYVNSDGNTSVYEGIFPEKNIENVNWVLHNNIGYFFPYKNNVVVKNDVVQGNWYDIAISQPDEEIKGKVFSLVNYHHNLKDAGDKYAYFLIPGVNEEQIKQYSKESKIEIISNTDSVQIVRHNGLNITEGVFYKECSINLDDFSLTVSEPCLLMIRQTENNEFIFHIADPLQTKKDIKVCFKSKNTSNIAIAKFSEVEDERAGETLIFTIIPEEATLVDNNLYEIKGHEGTYKVYNLSGNMLYESKFGGDLSQIKLPSKGVYPVMISINGKNYCLKLRSK